MKTTVCKHAGCFLSALEGKHYCQRHIAEEAGYGKRDWSKVKRKKSAPYHWLYATKRWHEMRRQFLNENPFCVFCGAVATVVDHVVPHGGNEELFYNFGNLQPLCKRHHDAKTLKENDYYKKMNERAYDGGDILYL